MGNGEEVQQSQGGGGRESHVFDFQIVKGPVWFVKRLDTNSVPSCLETLRRLSYL